ncbi:hypothetical protein A2U01_0067643, partial [Trifolium medium]|nr:hypothetical protein [Trifolium medium]
AGTQPPPIHRNGRGTPPARGEPPARSSLI